MAILKQAGIRLHVLTIPGSDLTDEGMEDLPMGNGIYLNISNSRISDAGLKHLPDNHPEVTSLSLSQTSIDDRGLRELHRLKRLDHINVQGTQVTAQGIADLKFVFPNCKIDSDHAGPNHQK